MDRPKTLLRARWRSLRIAWRSCHGEKLRALLNRSILRCTIFSTARPLLVPSPFPGRWSHRCVTSMQLGFVASISVLFWREPKNMFDGCGLKQAVVAWCGLLWVGVICRGVTRAVAGSGPVCALRPGVRWCGLPWPGWADVGRRALTVAGMAAVARCGLVWIGLGACGRAWTVAWGLM